MLLRDFVLPLTKIVGYLYLKRWHSYKRHFYALAHLSGQYILHARSEANVI